MYIECIMYIQCTWSICTLYMYSKICIICFIMPTIAWKVLTIMVFFKCTLFFFIIIFYIICQRTIFCFQWCHMHIILSESHAFLEIWFIIIRTHKNTRWCDDTINCTPHYQEKYLKRTSPGKLCIKIMTQIIW